MRKKINQKLIIKSMSEGFAISGYASVYDIADQHNDIIVKGAFADLENKNVKLLWQHNHEKPLGVIQNIFEDDYGLKVEAVINNKIEGGIEAIELIKQGAVNALSVGFNIVSSHFNDIGQRVITEANLIEISIVTFPANTEAQINFIQSENKNHNIKYNSKGVSMNIDNTHDKISKLEDEISSLHSYLGRPNVWGGQEIESKKHFNDYIRKGTQHSLITKSLSGAKDEGEVLLVPTLYNKILSLINLSSPMRKLASVETISTNALDIVIDDGKFACGWVGEAEARPDTANPKLIQKRIPVHELYAQPKATQKLIDDSAIQIESWLVERLKEYFLKEENTAFIHGDGDKKPTGILGADHHIEILEVKEKLVSPEILIDLMNGLDEDYLANATFLMNRTTLASIQKLKDSTGRFIWQPSFSDDLKQTIFGIPVVCCAEMPAIGQDKCSIALGDFKSAYKIVDRTDINIMRDPYTDKPFVKFYAVKRVGGDVVNPNAIKFAKFAE